MASPVVNAVRAGIAKEKAKLTMQRSLKKVKALSNWRLQEDATLPLLDSPGETGTSNEQGDDVQGEGGDDLRISEEERVHGESQAREHPLTLPPLSEELIKDAVVRTELSVGEGAADEEDSHSFRQEVWLFLSGEVARKGVRRFSKAYEVFSISLVILNVCLDIVGSMPEFRHLQQQPWVDDTMTFIGIVFTVEYVLRLWSCVECSNLSDLSACKARWRWACQGLSLVDGIVVFAFVIGQVLRQQASGLTALRMVRMFRLLALLKLEKEANSFGVIFEVFQRKKSELSASLASAMMIMVVSAVLMYVCEHDVQPDKFSSIPAAMWWSVAALTTVGYGDLVPVTGVGRLVGGTVAVFGVALFALPAGILGAGYVDVLDEQRKRYEDSAGRKCEDGSSEGGDCPTRSKDEDTAAAVRSLQRWMEESFDELHRGLAELQAQLSREASSTSRQPNRADSRPKAALSGPAMQSQGVVERLRVLELAVHGKASEGGCLPRLAALEADFACKNAAAMASLSSPLPSADSGTVARISALEVTIFGRAAQ
eukprot:TRINITY_DN42085_c0_g1_i1.p1 TRINITY_DN42085_c0_g1~~TRINITY_DN42085_c0_g1_i1.p1  ORF type:complete len:541 (+),score=115.11 TRINITY_DN42085_c0_g1_i1:67-1689(+)